jgi:hypothetical protein
MGIHLGNDLLAKREDNPTGFWEDGAVFEINQRLQSLAGADGYTLALSRKNIEQAAEYSGLRSQAVELVKDRLAQYPTWGFKDPHSCRLMFFWNEVFQILGKKPAYIVALRNPISVADSLLSRDRLRPAVSYALWLEYTILAVQDTRRRPQMVVSYERLLQEPREQIMRIARFLELESQVQMAQVETYRKEFLDPSLEHSRYPRESLDRRCRDIPLVSQVYELLSQRAEDRIGDEEFWSQWNALYARYGKEFPDFVKNRLWMLKSDLRITPPWHKWWLRLRQRGISEIGRLFRKAISKLAGHR